ncbi:Yersinia protein of uncharacterised function (DUF3831) [Yersinia enterocolitica]|nr:hypothetical protein CH48_639 [Yersinia enterocolitica]KGA63000.1 hypothetical protein DJ61_810 [Yersinia enterocolitica]KGA75331.1 hypothetical protein DJ62_3450 [Yersinia enterocolitica]CNG11346.1 Yersinia protein of uncharacterised function (DUF3831) [Yersinia enterocolitica]CNG94257.1 Yersinia protein of uncharacterised function (DUF3831) [Yersinia enterocolitica]
MARLEPSGTLILTKEVRRLYDLPVFTAAGTLSATSIIFRFLLPLTKLIMADYRAEEACHKLSCPSVTC